MKEFTPVERVFPFSVRVYGLLLKHNKLLVTEEKWFGSRMIKFPGGGLEFGESTIEALKREFIEECGIKISISSLFHIPEQATMAVFYKNVQVVPIYYLIDTNDDLLIPIAENWHVEEEMNDGDVYFHWIAMDSNAEMFSFPGDRDAAKHLQNWLKDSV